MQIAEEIVQRRPIQAYIFLAMAMSIAGSAVVAGKFLVSSIPVFLATELGIFVSLLILLPLAYLRSGKQTRLDGRTHLLLLAQAICGVVLYRVFTFWGLKYTSAAAGGLISGAAPALIALMAFLLLRERMPYSRLAGTVCVSAGIIVVNLLPFLNDSAQAANALRGNFLVLAAVICEALFSIMSKPQCRPMSAMFRTAMVSLYAFICLLPCALYDLLRYDFCTMDMPSLLCIGYYGVFVSFLSYVFWFKGIATVPAGVAASFTGFVPVSSVFLSWLVLNEQILAPHWFGLFFVLGGICISCKPGTVSTAGNK